MTTTNGTLVGKVSSTVSSPTVHYAATYTATRTNASSAAVAVAVKFTAWLNSGSSSLGTGAKLTVYARINGGGWKNVVLKSTSASWSGTDKHSVTLTLSANTKSDSADIEFYVTRSGSTFNGTAGNLGSASGPKKYAAALPAYSAKNYYSITYSVSGAIPEGYSAPYDSKSYAEGSTVTVKAVPAYAGYTFSGWKLDGKTVTSFRISGNSTLSGVWSLHENSPVTPQKYACVNVGGVWKKAVSYVNASGVWKKAAPSVNVGGMWKTV